MTSAFFLLTIGYPVLYSFDTAVWYHNTTFVQSVKLEDAKERILSYLPLSHIAALVVDAYSATLVGSTVHFAEPDALKSSLVASMIETKPTFFFAVPRVWEKMEEKFSQIANRGGCFSLFLNLQFNFISFSL